MRIRPWLSRIVLAAVIAAASAHSAAAQITHVTGLVKDASGQGIRGATIRAENPAASPSTFTASSDEKGRFALVGLRSGQWTFVAEAPGYEPQAVKTAVSARMTARGTQIDFTLARAAAVVPFGALGGIPAKDLQTELSAADELYNAAKWDQAIAAYKAILTKAPALSVINLQIASANLEGGDVQRAKGENDEAAKYYQRAADLNPAWGKPVFRLGQLAAGRGDKDAAVKLMEKVIVIDPTSAEATQAKTLIEQYKK